MRADGEQVDRLTPSTMIAEQPAWSPDGKRLAFNCDVDVFPDTCTVAPDGGGLTRITTAGNHAGLDWSPDGVSLVFAANKGNTVEIFVMLASGDDEMQLTDNLATDLEPAWSPDGNWIAFSSNRDGRWGIYVMTAQGTSARRLTFTDTDPPGGNWLQGNSGSPAWSPDGKWIAYVSHQDGNREIYIMRSDGTEKTRLTWNDAADLSPAWRP
jgi:Tol biopolymer transport system component